MVRDALVSRRQDNPDTGLGPRQEIVIKDEHSVVAVVVAAVACRFDSGLLRLILGMYARLVPVPGAG